MQNITITSHRFVNAFGKVKFNFVVTGQAGNHTYNGSKSLKAWSSSAAAIRAGKREFRLI